MRDRIRPIAILTAIVVVGAGVWFGSQLRPSVAGESAPAAGTEAQPVEVVKPARSRMFRTLDVPSIAEALEQADIYSKVSGYVSEVKVDIGQAVKAGDPLALLDVPEMANDLAEAQAQRAAKAALADAAKSSGVKSAAAAAAQAGKKLEVARRSAERRRVESAMHEAAYARALKLREAQAATDQALEEADTRRKVAEVEVAIAEAQVEAAEADLDSAKAAEAVAQSNVLIALAQVDHVDAQIARIRTMMKYATIVAPFDGVVTRRLIDRGALVQASTSGRTTPLFTLHRLDSVRLFIDVPEVDVPFVKPGVTAHLVPRAALGTLPTATVTRISSALNPATRTMRAEIDVPNPGGRFVAGMDVHVSLEIDIREDAVTIPATALLTEGSSSFVYVAQNDVAEKRKITTGLDDGIRIEVVEGLKVDEWIVVTGKGLVRPGDRIKPVPKAN